MSQPQGPKDLAHGSEAGADAPPASIERLIKSRQRQLRALLILTAAGIVAVTLIMAIAGRLLVQRFAQVERSDAEQKAAQLYHAAAADLAQLSITNRNNAEWDDAADFVVSRSPGFLSSNFTAPTLGELHIDLAWILDKNGESLFSGLYDRATHTLASPAPGPLLAQIAEVLRTHEHNMLQSTAGEVIRTSSGLMAISVMEITRTDRSAPTGALMLAGRLLGAEEIARIAETSQLPLVLTMLPDSANGAGDLPQAVLQWAHSANGSPTFAYERGPDVIAGYALIRDFKGAPVALLSTQHRRDIYALGLRTATWLLGSIALALIIFTSVLLGLSLRLRRTLLDYEVAQQRLQRLARQLRDMVLLVSPHDLCIVDANEATLTKLGCTLEQIRTRTLTELYPQLTAHRLESLPRSGDGTAYESMPLSGQSGTRIWTDVTVNWLNEGQQDYWCLVATDVTHREEVGDLKRENKRQLSHIAQHDALTGLPNRVYLNKHLKRKFEEAASAPENFNALYYINIGQFKNINDVHGHGVGDRVLKVLAKRLRASLAAEDVLARVGGDEFAIAVAQLPAMSAVEGLAARIQTVLRAPIVIEDKSVSLSCSIGIALFPDHGSGIETLLKHAEIAMYGAKEAGRGQHRLFSLDMKLEIKGRADLLQSLREAIGTSQLRLTYQPIFDLKTGQLAAFEALPEWEHPENGLMPRETFIAAAEEGHLMAELGGALLEMACDALKRWGVQSMPIVPIALHLSPRQLEQTDFVDVVGRLCAGAGVQPHNLHFQLSEGAFRENLERIRPALQELRRNGHKVFMDEFAFGAGYSSPSQFAHVPVDGIKLAAALLDQEASALIRLPLIRAILEMSRTLGLTTIADGVHTVDQLAILIEQGCELAQGPFLGNSLTAGDAESLLTRTQGDVVLSESTQILSMSRR